MRLIGFSRALVRASMALLLLATAIYPLRAQTDPAATYPNKPIKVIVGFAAGGGNDIFARLVGQKLSEILGATLVIENRPNAGGRLAAEFVANQPADGYTILVGATGMMSIASAIFPHLKYHPSKSFIPLTMIADFPLIMAGPAKHPAKTVQEIIAFAKANPEKANYASSSPAFTIATELLKLKTGMPGVMIPWKSSNEMMLCVASEHCLIAIADGPPTVPLVKGGQIRALAVTGSERSGELPDVPSMGEIGYPEVNTKLWSGYFAPAATPPGIARKLETALRTAINSPEVSSKLMGMAVHPGGIPSEEFRKRIDADILTYAEVVKAANLKFEE